MKYRFKDRIVLLLGSLITILIGLGILVVGLQITGSIQLSGDGDAFFTWMRIGVLAAGLFTVAFGAYVLALPARNNEKHRFVVQQTDNGELRISIKAIENLVQKCIDMHNEISVVSMRIDNGRDGVRINLCISLANNISIPLAVASLQKQIKQYLLASSGIDVRDVCVSVETASSDVGESPYMVSSEVSPGARDAQPQEKSSQKKKPLHQRIFSREAPAVMLPPDPPKTADKEPPREEPAPVQEPEKPAEQEPADEAVPEMPATEDVSETPVKAPDALDNSADEQTEDEEAKNEQA